MTAPAEFRRDAYTTPPCRIDEHNECPGPCEVKTPRGDLVETLRCNCDCHRTH
ncbi:hypothetical protein [Streptomyces scopuliridis]|uniref:hypothetical protein n=1 Tax=Streptomyces scopuliridis TaxID=452529 RepID=UPI003689EDE5